MTVIKKGQVAPQRPSPKVVRRSILAALVITPAAMALPAAAASRQPDAELQRIGRELDCLIPAIDAATADQERCGVERDRLVRAEPIPAALYRRPADNIGCWEFGQKVYGAETAYNLRQSLPRWRDQMATDPGAAHLIGLHRAIPRAEEVLSAWDEQRRVHRWAEDISGFTAATDYLSGLLTRIHTLFERTQSLKATTMAGLAVKARLADWYWSTPEPDEDADMDVQAVRSLLRDLVREGRA